jgi:subtilisin family serine protease
MAGRRWFLFILSLILILGLGVPAGAQLPPLPQAIPLIVHIAPTASINAIAGAWGGTVVDSIPGADTYLLNVPPALPSFNLSLLGIQWVEINTGVSIPGFAVLGVVRVPGTVASDWYKNQPAWQLIEAHQALRYSTGNRIVIADINSKVDYRHPALVGHLTNGYDFVASKPEGSAALNQSEAGFLDQSEAGFLDQSEAGFLDQSEAGFLDSTGLLNNPAYGHGTLCAGVIAAIAPDSMIMPLRAFDDKGESDLFTLAKAIRYAVQNGAQVINMSFGTYYPSKSLQSAIHYAQQHNVLLAASAGNDNTSHPQYPAAFKGVMTTAATDLRDKKAAFSNYGRDIFVDAPGVNIISAYPGGYYGIVSGTSFSAPAVAATAALVRSLHATGVSKSITGGAVNIDSKNPGYAGQLGYGRIDVLRAVSRTVSGPEHLDDGHSGPEHLDDDH